MTRIGSLVLLALVTFTPRGAADEGPPRPCVESHGEARFRGLAYDHVVILANRCEVKQRCEVATDVAPTPVTAEVAGQSTVEVLTFRGSPASTFQPRVSCQPAR